MGCVRVIYFIQRSLYGSKLHGFRQPLLLSFSLGKFLYCPRPRDTRVALRRHTSAPSRSRETALHARCYTFSPKKQGLPGVEPGLPESEFRVRTITPGCLYPG